MTRVCVPLLAATLLGTLIVSVGLVVVVGHLDCSERY